MAGPVLKLDLYDVFERRLQEPALITLQNQRLSEVLQARSSPGKPLAISGVQGGPNGVYRVEADPAGYLASAQFVSVKASGTTTAEMYFAIDPRKVRGVTFPAFEKLPGDLQRLLDTSSSVSGFEGTAGKTLYDGLDDLRRAGLLNISTKCGATVLPNGRAVLSYLQSLRDLRGDRFFCAVPQLLRDDVKNAAQGGMFESVSGALHHPPAGFEPAGSFKTQDRYGNLQLTFFAGSTEWVADIDIDDANGLGHVFQVVRNELTGRPTHPYDIQQILMGYQKLDTTYRLQI